jgi:hypothetical protein
MGTTYTLISTARLSSASASSISFTSIPQTYTDLVLNISLRATGTDSVDAWDMPMSVNGSGTLITASLRGDGGGTNYNDITDRLLRQIVPSSWTANTFSNGQIYFPSYTSSNYKVFDVKTVTENDAAGASQIIIAGAIATTSPITSLTFTVTGGVNFAQHSSMSLYGISKS